MRSLGTRVEFDKPLEMYNTRTPSTLLSSCSTFREVTNMQLLMKCPLDVETVIHAYKPIAQLFTMLYVTCYSNEFKSFIINRKKNFILVIIKGNEL